MPSSVPVLTLHTREGRVVAKVECPLPLEPVRVVLWHGRVFVRSVVREDPLAYWETVPYNATPDRVEVHPS